MSQIELLAPAGNFEALKAAVEAGANAVYLAGNHFGARAYAGNFSNDELEKAVEFAHLRNVAVHVTVNTIVSDEEFDMLEKYFQFLQNINVDAILVQDLGVANLAKRFAPNLSLHASTQMTVHSLEGVKALEDLGFNRIVLARELSIDEIKNICDHTSVEIEIFMHGALCVCYSGQCLMSSMIGARSGNRGQCAQPCRLPYEFVDDNNVDLLKDKAGQYLLSPKDLNTIDLLPQLINTGVSSLKIEGRMKRPEYVAIVVETYRAAIDSYIQKEKNFSYDKANHRLAQIFNRDFTTAYLERNQGRQMISDKKPNNRGLLVGRVISIDKNSINIKSTEKINLNDQLEIWVKVGGRVTFTVNDFQKYEDIYHIKIDNIRGIKLHDRVFKIFDAELTEHARKFFNKNSAIRRIKVDAEITARLNEPLKLKMTDIDGNIAEILTKSVAAKAKNQPLNYEVIQKQISRLGTSIYELAKLKVDIDNDIIIPISELNEIRRQATDILNDKRLSKFIKTTKNVQIKSKFKRVFPSKNKGFYLQVAVDNIEKLNLAIQAGADLILFGGESFHHEIITPKIYRQAISIVQNAGKKIYISTPRIVRNAEQPQLEKILTSVDNANGIYVHNLATLRLAKNLTNLPICSDFSMITFNSETIKFLAEFGVESVTLSPELTLEQIKSLTKNSPLPVECIVHGRIELMISSYCTAGSFIGGVGEHICSQPCKRQKFYLRDRKQAIFPIVTDQFCRMHILNSKILSMLPHVMEFKNIGVNRIRIDGRAMPNNELFQTIRNYRLAMADNLVVEENDITRGHYFRGVLK